MSLSSSCTPSPIPPGMFGPPVQMAQEGGRSAPVPGLQPLRCWALAAQGRRTRERSLFWTWPGLPGLGHRPVLKEMLANLAVAPRWVQSHRWGARGLSPFLASHCALSHRALVVG